MELAKQPDCQSILYTSHYKVQKQFKVETNKLRKNEHNIQQCLDQDHCYRWLPVAKWNFHETTYNINVIT